MKHNSVTIAPVSSLEVGDLIAREFIGGVIAGKITGIVYAAYQLTDEQRAYPIENEITIPENKFEPLGGHNSYLIFGDFNEIMSLNRTGIVSGATHQDHMFVDRDVNVAVFPYTERPRIDDET